MANDMLGTTEVGELLGVTRQRVHQLRQEHDDFPTPTIEQTRATFWRRRDIERWGRKHGYIAKET